MNDQPKASKPIPEEWRADYERYKWILGIGATGLVYWIRSLFIRPAPIYDRCVMGGPVHPWVHCPRYAMSESLWCRKHGGNNETA